MLGGGRDNQCFRHFSKLSTVGFLARVSDWLTEEYEKCESAQQSESDAVPIQPQTGHTHSKLHTKLNGLAICQGAM